MGEPSASRSDRDAAGAVRERLVRQGPGGLCDEELVALLLAGTRAPSAADIARARGCLAAAGGLGALAAALGSPAGAARSTLPIRGAARARLVASFELGRRTAPAGHGPDRLACLEWA